uniref:Small ribosomal subunit protein uS12m n=1 Tax=Ciona savignyi TaxID=51511 RepID=H2ZBM4_CIOSA
MSSLLRTFCKLSNQIFTPNMNTGKTMSTITSVLPRSFDSNIMRGHFNSTWFNQSLRNLNMSCQNFAMKKRVHRMLTFEELDQRMMKYGDGKYYLKPKRKSKMDGKPQMKGVVLKLMVKKPKKPNSANRRCCKLRLSNGKEVTAYIPGEGHNLQQHNVVLVRGGKRQDLIGVHYRVIRGKLDCGPVIKPVS